MDYYVYKFVKGNEVLYVGQTIDLDRRMHEHIGRIWDLEKDKIFYAKCKTRSDMNIYEMYYINKYPAKYNDCIVFGDKPSFELPELTWKEYTKSIIEERHDAVINNARNTFSNKFDPQNYWKNKISTLEDELNKAQKDSEEYNMLLAKIDKCNEQIR